MTSHPRRLYSWTVTESSNIDDDDDDDDDDAMRHSFRSHEERVGPSIFTVGILCFVFFLL
jgi:hypothetical protein